MLVATLLASAVLVPTALRAQDTSETPTYVGKPKIELFTQPVSRPLALPALYVSLVGLQAYDGYTTLRGVKNGAQEANALVGGLAGEPAAFWAIKGGSTALSIYMAEKLWRNHRRTEAIVTMVVVNGVMAAIAARNTVVLRSR
jgi:hypothetical protein